MWSGPRNISTALMRSWGNRPDTFVCDEPLYGFYLKSTGLPHPGRDEVVAHHECDWKKVAAWLTGPVPQGRGIFYQKHMAHHLLPEAEGDWLDELVNCLLIREPREMLTSLVHFIPEPVATDTGLPQQLRIFDRVANKTGRDPLVIDARDLLEDPEGMLRAVCDRLGVAFTAEMLSWPPGLRETDGIWAKHWYDKVKETTGFGSYRPKPDPVPEVLLPLLETCNEMYGKLAAGRLRVQ